MQVHFNDAGIGCDFEDVEPRVMRRRVALNQHGKLELRRGVFDGGNELEVLLERRDRWHEDVQFSIARFDAQSGAHDPGGRFAGLWRTRRRRGLSLAFRPGNLEPWRPWR